MRLRGWLLGMSLVAVAGCATQPSRNESVSAPSAEARAPETDPAATVSLKRSVDIHALKAGQAVQIDNPYGDVRIRFGGYEHQLEWRTVGQQGSGSGVIAITGSDGAAFRVQARLPAGSVLAPDQRVDITVYLPEGHDIDVLTERGLIEARGVKGKLKARSTSGSIAFRGIGGSVDVETGSGMIEGQLDAAPAGASQRIATITGNIVLGVVDGLNAALTMATSGVFATEFSIQIDPQPGQEPNKRGRAEIGKPLSSIDITSKRGEIRLLRRLEFRPA